MLRTMTGTKYHSARNITLLAVVASVFMMFPLLSHAQTSDTALSATIRAELMSDPRTASLSQAQVDEMVTILTQQAQAQGMTASDITRRPGDPETFGAGGAPQPVDTCEGTPTLFCVFDTAYGFLGPDTSIPFLLGMASMGLVWVLAEMIHRRRYPAAVASPAPMSSGAPL